MILVAKIAPTWGPSWLQVGSQIPQKSMPISIEFLMSFTIVFFFGNLIKIPPELFFNLDISNYYERLETSDAASAIKKNKKEIILKI